MTTKLNDSDLSCFAIDDDNVAIVVKEQKFVIDYSMLIDFLTELAVVASQVEARHQAKLASGEDGKICNCHRLH